MQYFCRPFPTIGQWEQADFRIWYSRQNAPLNGFANLTCGQSILEGIGCNEDFHLDDWIYMAKITAFEYLKLKTQKGLAHNGPALI